jgi:hypothetical protein
MKTRMLLCPLTALALSLPSAQPAAAQFTGRSNEVVAECRAVDDVLTVGQCLAFERENSTNEYSAGCRLIRDLGLLPLEPEEGEEGDNIRTVGDCVGVLKAEDL